LNLTLTVTGADAAAALKGSFGPGQAAAQCHWSSGDPALNLRSDW
jgi:hypothetical protein